MRTEKRAQIAIILACTSPHFQSHQLSGFEVEDLNSSKKEIVHARRICFYQGKLDDEQVNPELLKYAEHSETIYQNVSALTDIQKGENGLENFS